MPFFKMRKTEVDQVHGMGEVHQLRYAHGKLEDSTLAIEH